MKKTAMVHLRLQPSLLAAIQQAAKRGQTTQSHVMRQSLLLGVREYASRLDPPKESFPPGSLLPFITPERNREQLILNQGCSLRVDADE